MNRRFTKVLSTAALGSLLFFWGSIAAAADTPVVRGLLIGLSDYKDPAWPRLIGAGKDPLRVRDAVCSRFKMAPDSFSILDQSKADRRGIEAALRQLSKDAKPGETVIVFYAGHGDQVADRATPTDSPWETLDEQDGMDECLVPLNAPAPSHPTFADSVVRDDFIDSILTELSSKVRSEGKLGSVVFIFDSCSSGTLSRSAKLSGRIPRTGRNSATGDAKMPTSLNRPNFVGAQSHSSGNKGWVSLSACLPRQTAKESPGGGDFTTALTMALEDHRIGPQSNYRELIRLVNQVGDFSDQLPQAEGDLDLALFGGGAEPRTPSIKVVKVVPSKDSQIVTLDKGLLMGITPGSKVELYSFGTKSVKESQNKLAEGEIVASGITPYKSELRLKGSFSSEQLRSLSSAVAWVSKQAVGEMDVRIFLGQLAAEAQSDLRKKLTSIPLATLVNQAGQADVVAISQSEKLGFVTLERTRSSIGPDKLLDFNLSDPSAPDLLSETFKEEARRRYLAKIINEPEKLQVELLAGRFEGKSVDSFKPSPINIGKDGLPVFRAGDDALLKITNKDTRKLYISVLDYGPSGEIEPMYPRDTENEGEALAPGQTVGVDLKFNYDGQGKDGLREGFKVFATTEPLELQYLKTKGARRIVRTKAITSPFVKLFETCVTGTRSSQRALEPKDYVGREILQFNVIP